TFQFISKRHHGFPFSLTFFLNGLQVNRLSSCCEYKHRKGSRLGGKRGYFGFVCVERASPCYKCIIAMGLDKKASKARKEDSEKREELKKGEGKLRKGKMYLIPKRTEMENKISSSTIFSTLEENSRISKVRTALEEMERKGRPGQDLWEDDQEHIYKYEYEEDFEIDEEKENEKANEEGQADDQMNGMSKSPSDDKKDNLDPEKGSETSSQKVPDADDNMKDESDGCPDSELEEDKQDRKNTSSASSRSHPNSAGSEEGSSVEYRDTHTDTSSRESTRSSFSQEVNENDEPRNEESLIIKIQDQEIREANVETKPRPIDEGSGNILKGEKETGAKATTESMSAKSKKHVSKKKREKDQSTLWVGSHAKAKDEKAVFPSVYTGGKYVSDLQPVRQLIDESLESSCHSLSDAEPGVSSSEEQGKHLKKQEIDTHRAPNGNLMMEERPVLNSDEESENVIAEVYTMEKKEAIKEEEASQDKNTNRVESKEETTLLETIEINEIPFGEWKTIAVQPILAEAEFTVKREVQEDIMNVAGEAASGVINLGKEGLSPTGKETVGNAASLNEDGTPDEQGLMETVLEKDKVVSEEEQVSEKSVLEKKTASLNSEYIVDSTDLKEACGEATMPLEKGETEREATMYETGSEKADEEETGEATFINLENVRSVDEEPDSRKDGLEEAIVEGEEPAKELEEMMVLDASLSISVSEKAEVNLMSWQNSSEEGRGEDTEREKIVTEAEVNRDNDRKEMLSQEVDIARERKEPEEAETYLRETESEREEVKRTNTLRCEEALEDKFSEEEETVKESRTENETKTPTKEIESNVENIAPVEELELTDNAASQSENSLPLRGTSMFEEGPAFEKSWENVAALWKEGEETLTEARDTEHKGESEQFCMENVMPPEKEEGPQYDEEGVLGSPVSKPPGEARAPEVTIITPGEGQERATAGQDCLADLPGKEEEGSSQKQEGVGDTVISQQEIPERDSMRAETFSEGVGVDVEEEVKEGNVGKGMKNKRTKEFQILEKGAIVAEEAFNEGETLEMATEKMGESTDVMRTEGETTNKASSISDVAEEETGHEVGELVGKPASPKRMGIQEAILGSEAVPEVEEVTGTSTTEVQMKALQKPLDSEGEADAPQLGGDREGGEEERTPRAGSVEEEVGTGSSDRGPESGATEAFRPSQERESEPGRESLQTVETLPAKPDLTETQEKQEHSVERESKDAHTGQNPGKASETTKQTVSLSRSSVQE
ncbi:PREDICTED: uncharacterized protein C1orf173 homolog, partial [Elephantulus edwardii]|uniref:uncharacterized protein C1orf173 homolog n=1 Tax=Elephantulus edwardii TaxID=28737 RepID=UPI0003F07E78